MDISNLSPDQQKSFLALLGQANQQSMDPSAFNSSITPQEGDKMHPMDAIQQISDQMQGPQTPSGVSIASGPQIVKNPDGQLIAKVKAGGSPIANILGLLGMKQSVPVDNPNYYQAAKQAGIEKFLPSGLGQMPDGTPFVGPDTFAKALVAKKANENPNNPPVTKQEFMDYGGSEKQWKDAGLGDGDTMPFTKVRGLISKESADAMTQRAEVMKIKVGMQAMGVDAAQPMAETANKNLGTIQRSLALINQIDAQNGKANMRQQSELAANLATLVANSSGQLTDERMNQFMPKSAMQKYGGWKEFLTNEQAPIDFSGFLPQMRDLVYREQNANRNVSQAAAELGLNALSALGQSGMANRLNAARNNTPLFGANPNPTYSEPRIRVMNIKTGQVGTMPESKFDQTKYRKL